MLIVDDNVDAADMLSELLRIEGHTVFSAHDGEQALEVAAAEQPDVILLDIGLPKLNGYQVAAELRKRAEFSDTLLIAVTGFGQGIDRKRSKSAGFDLHLVKPVAPKVLREVILPAASR